MTVPVIVGEGRGLKSENDEKVAIAITKGTNFSLVCFVALSISLSSLSSSPSSSYFYSVFFFFVLAEGEERGYFCFAHFIYIYLFVCLFIYVSVCVIHFVFVSVQQHSTHTQQPCTVQNLFLYVIFYFHSRLSMAFFPHSHCNLWHCFVLRSYENAIL